MHRSYVFSKGSTYTGAEGLRMERPELEFLCEVTGNGTQYWYKSEQVDHDARDGYMWKAVTLRNVPDEFKLQLLLLQE